MFIKQAGHNCFREVRSAKSFRLMSAVHMINICNLDDSQNIRLNVADILWLFPVCHNALNWLY